VKEKEKAEEEEEERMKVKKRKQALERFSKSFGYVKLGV